jgi:hypothetical protein
MVDKSTDLDSHRGMAAQKATELRRSRTGFEAEQTALRAKREKLEAMLVAQPAAGWPDAVQKARYLLGLFRETEAARDPRRRRLIANVLEEFEQLLAAERGPSEPPAPQR